MLAGQTPLPNLGAIPSLPRSIRWPSGTIADHLFAQDGTTTGARPFAGCTSLNGCFTGQGGSPRAAPSHSSRREPRRGARATPCDGTANQGSARARSTPGAATGRHARPRRRGRTIPCQRRHIPVFENGPTNSRETGFLPGVGRLQQQYTTPSLRARHATLPLPFAQTSVGPNSVRVRTG